MLISSCSYSSIFESDFFNIHLSVALKYYILHKRVKHQTTPIYHNKNVLSCIYNL